MISVNKHQNNFDFIRIVAALMVLFTHQFDLMRQPAPILFPIGFGELGVCIFFTVSGFLVAQSWCSDPHILRFIARRFLRIWPGLTVVTALAALVMGPLITSVSLHDYFHSGQTFNFFRSLLLEIQYVLPGVFATNPYPNAVNGSLWTIPLEIKWYEILLIGGVLRLLKFKWIIFTIMVLVAVYQFGIYHAETNPEPHYTRQFGLYFIYGTCMHLFLAQLTARRFLVGLVIIGAAILIYIAGHPIIALWLALPYLVIAFGTLQTPVISRFGRFGDLSYGIYIYAFPVQQLGIWLNQGRYPLVICLLFSLVVTVLCAYVSWHCVEKQAMKLKPRLNQTKPTANH